jgi:hypothetical protein
MRRYSILPLLGLAAALGCGDDSRTGPPASYSLEPAATAIAVGQDSSTALTVAVKREGTDTTIKRTRLRFASADPHVATVDSLGVVTGVAGGSTTVNVKLANASIDVPVTVRAHPADSVLLTILTGPAGGLKGAPGDTIGTFYALPADPATSRVKGVVKVGNDTVFCNYCRTRSPARVMRPVRFVVLEPLKATVSNANNPKLQTSTDTTGRVTPLDTSAAHVRIVMEVPGDSNDVGRRWKDTVKVNFSLRPIDSLRIRPDSNFFPAANGTGLQKQIYQNADNEQANVVASSTTNFIAGLDFLSKVQDIPSPATPTTIPAPRFIVSRLVGGPTTRRPSLPNVLWESANTNYLTVNAAGAVTGVCAQIGGNCLSTGSTVLTCAATAGTMPAAFLGKGKYAIPSCNKEIDMPGAFCTTANQNDLSSTCTIWIRATATDPVSGAVLRQLYRINIRR